MKLFRRDNPLTPSWDLVRPSFEMLKQNIWAVFYLSFFPQLIISIGLLLSRPYFNQFLVEGAPRVAVDGTVSTGFAVILIGMVLSLACYPGYVYLQLQAIRGDNPSATDSFMHGIRRFFPIIIVSLFVTVAISVGMYLLIIPGLLLLRGLLLASFYVIDKRLKPFDALKMSYADSKPNAGWLWGTIGVYIMFAIFSTLIGQIPVAGTILSLAVTYIYAFALPIRYGEITGSLKVKFAQPQQ